jgi:flagellar hook-length control protein FliK
VHDFQLPATTAPTPHAPATPAGHAGGAVAIEIFTSFRALVDALTTEGGSSTSGASKGARGTDDGAPAPAEAGAKGDDDAARVVPVDLAALIASPTVPPQGAGGTAPQGAATPDSHGHHVWTAADLAALLLGERGTKAIGPAAAPDAKAEAAADAVDLSGGEPAPPSGPSVDAATSSERGDRITDARVAQAMAQRLLASAAGPRRLIEELAGQAGARSKNALDDLMLQSLLTPDRAPSAMNPASRLVASLTSAVTAASAAPTIASDVGAPASASSELLSTETADQIIQAIRLQWTRGGGEAQIRLEPRQFGDLTVSVRVDQGEVVARLQADTAVVREWLQANEHLLRRSLADQHLTLTRLEVSEPSAASAESRQRAPRDGSGQPPPDGRPPRRPRTPETGETFDIVA